MARVDRCVQIMGGQGVTGESLVERIFRETRAFRIYDGRPRCIAGRWPSASPATARTGDHGVADVAFIGWQGKARGRCPLDPHQGAVLPGPHQLGFSSRGANSDLARSVSAPLEEKLTEGF